MTSNDLCSIEWCGKPLRAAGLCLPHLRRRNAHGDPLCGRAYAGEPQAFLRLAVQDAGAACIIWPYARDRLGYGRLVFRGRPMPAHRAAWELHHGRDMEASMDACHAPEICHTRSCINPLHIREASRIANMADTIVDGTHNRGERSGRVKLTEVAVRDIRASGQPHRLLAIKYGVSRDTVRSIKCGRRWAWLA